MIFPLYLSEKKYKVKKRCEELREKQGKSSYGRLYFHYLILYSNTSRSECVWLLHTSYQPPADLTLVCDESSRSGPWPCES